MANIATLPVVDQTASDGYTFSTRTSNHMAKAGKGQTEMALGIISWHSENPSFHAYNSPFIGNGSARDKDRAITINGKTKSLFAEHYSCSEQLVSLTYSCLVATLQDMTDSAMNELMVVTPTTVDDKKKTLGGFVSFDYKAIHEATKSKTDPLVFAIKTETSASTKDQTVQSRVDSAIQGLDRSNKLIAESKRVDRVENGVIDPGGIKLKLTDPTTGVQSPVRSSDHVLTRDQIIALADAATKVLIDLPCFDPSDDPDDSTKRPIGRLTDFARLDYVERNKS